MQNRNQTPGFSGIPGLNALHGNKSYQDSLTQFTETQMLQNQLGLANSQIELLNMINNEKQKEIEELKYAVNMYANQSFVLGSELANIQQDYQNMRNNMLKINNAIRQKDDELKKREAALLAREKAVAEKEKALAKPQAPSNYANSSVLYQSKPELSNVDYDFGDLNPEIVIEEDFFDKVLSNSINKS